MTRRVGLGAALAAVLVAANIVTDGYPVVAASLVLAPMSVALFGDVRETSIVAVLALLGALIGAAATDTWTSRWAVAVLVAAIGSALAVVLAALRARAESEAANAQRLTRVERRLTSALDALGEAVTVMSADGMIVYVNDAAVSLLRAGSREDLLGAAPGSVMSRFAVFDEHGHALARTQLPGYRLLHGEAEAPPLLVRNVVIATGEERWLLNKATLIRGDGPQGDSVVNVIEDLTAIKRAELRERLLSEATAELSRSLDYESTLQRVAEVAVPGLADWCSVSLPGPRDSVEEVAIAHADPEKVALGRRLQEHKPALMTDDSPRAAVLRGEAGTSLVQVPEGALEGYADDPEHLEMLRGVGLSSILTVPLDAGGRRLGAMLLARGDPQRPFAPEDVSLAEELAARAATAVLNAQLYTEHAEIAATLQRGMLPPPMPWMPGWSAAALYHPAGEIAEVGGDFFDAFRAGEDWMVVIGDVAGHGPPAATLTALARHTLRTAAALTGDPARAIAQLNDTLLQVPEMALCTAACLHLRTDGERAGVVRIACAGHPLPVLVRDGDATPLGSAGPLAGAFGEVEWPVREATVRPGDVLVLFTDGVLDAMSHRGRLDEKRILDRLREGPATATGIIAHLDAALAIEPEQRRRDDTAAIALEFLGVAARTPA
jgi:serine phosphatase RsbU (regulator of sigma subunit)/PAS domain-containing protein